MDRRVALFVLLLATVASTGCGMCQSCQDLTGPVMQAPNQGDYYNSPRVNSSVGGAPIMEEDDIPMQAQAPAQLTK